MTLRNKTIGGICVFFSLFVIVSLLLYKGSEQSRKKAIILSRTESYADMAEKVADPESLSLFLPDDLRITILDAEGNVTYDSFESNLSSHADRPEIRDAIALGRGISVRESETSSLPYIYFARKTDDGRIIRIAQVFELDLKHFLRTDWPLIAGIFALALATLLGIYILVDRAQRKERENAEKERRRLKHEMTSNISHELRTPVCSIQGYLEILMNHPFCPEEKRRTYIARAYAQAATLSDMIRDISLVTKMEEAPGLFPKEPLFLRVLVDRLYEEMAPQLEAKKMQLHNEIPQGYEVVANEGLLYAIFRNLIENSIKYAGEETEIHIEQTAGQKIVYRDNGRGVSEEEISHIFDRFWRSPSVRGIEVCSNAATLSETSGSGLGLSIVRNAVYLHGATIRAYTPPSGGLTFILEGL